MKITKNLKIFHKSHDGGADSGVTGWWLIEWKSVFSIVLLRFSKGSREAYHSHAFNALTWWLKGEVKEEFQDGSNSIVWRPSFKPKYTPRSNFHKITGLKKSWAFCIRGPWSKTWNEVKKDKMYTLTHGRYVVDVRNIKTINLLYIVSMKTGRVSQRVPFDNYQDAYNHGMSFRGKGYDFHIKKDVVL